MVNHAGFIKSALEHSEFTTLFIALLGSFTSVQILFHVVCFQCDL